MPEFSEERELSHIRTFVVRAVYIDGRKADLVDSSISVKLRMNHAVALRDAG